MNAGRRRVCVMKCTGLRMHQRRDRRAASASLCPLARSSSRISSAPIASSSALSSPGGRFSAGAPRETNARRSGVRRLRRAAEGRKLKRERRSEGA